MAAFGRIEELRKRYDENPRRFFAPLANEYRKSGDLEQAITLCRQHLTDAPNNLSGQIVFGQALFDAGSFEESEAAFGIALGIDPENLIALRHLGDIARVQSDVPRARQWYQRVLDADRRNDEVIAILEELASVEAAAPAAAPAEAPAASEEMVVEPTSLVEEVLPSEPAPAVAEEPAPPPPVPQSQVKTVEIPAMRRPPVDVDAISFDDEPVAAVAAKEEVRAPEPPPPPSVGFSVDFGAESEVGMSDEPMIGAVGESSAFGVVDVPEESPFGTAADFTPVTPFGTIGRRAPDVTPPRAVRPVTPVGAAPPPPPPQRPPTPPEPVQAQKPAPLELEVDVDDAPPIRAREGAGPPKPPSAAGLDAFELEDDSDSARPSAPTEKFADFDPVRTLPTPIAPVTPVDSASSSFSTETMAELYVSQGLRHKAIAVYQELIRTRPDDAALRERLASLEGEGRGATTLTARKFFSQLATRRATPGRTQTPVPDTPVVEPTPRGSGSTAAPAREMGERASGRVSGKAEVADFGFGDEPVSRPSGRVSVPKQAPMDDDALTDEAVDSIMDDTVADEPVAEDVADAPARSAAPEAEEPPAADELAAEELAADEPAADEPAADEPAADEPEEPRTDRPTLDALFGNPAVSETDNNAAQSLAAAFGSEPRSVSGRPTRSASDEVSLDQVFRRAGSATPPGGLSVPRQSATLRFDQFFAGGSAESSANQPETPPADPSGDSEQFQSWLSGLKKP